MILELDQIRRLSRTAAPPADLAEILAKAEALELISLEEAAALLALTEPEVLARLQESAWRVKQKVFGPRVVLFAPLYLSNRCINNCLYCGFRAGHRGRRTRTLSADEAVQEAGALAALGYQRLLLVTSEHPETGVDYLVSVVRALYEQTPLRILHLNAPPLPRDELRRLKQAGLGVYQVFQETYDPECYRRFHPSGPKADYSRRLAVMDEAVAAGFDDVGMGVLLGLNDYRFEALAAIAHSRYLWRRYRLHPHTLSVPRLRPAEGSPLSEPPVPVSDADFLKIVAVYRLAVPTAGVVVTTRESKRLREQALLCGASQISAGSRTEPGGYAREDSRAGPPVEAGDAPRTSQFEVEDHRTLAEVILDLVAGGHLPSLCTACYRSGRTGARFAELAGQGRMSGLCQANALLSLTEYLVRHDHDERFGPARALVERLVEELGESAWRETLRRKIAATRAGSRDEHY